MDFSIHADSLSAAKVGSWKVEFDEGKPPRMYPDATMLQLIGIDDPEGMTPEDIHKAWLDRVDPAHVTALDEGVKYMAAGEQAEIQYPWHHPDGRTIIVRCGGVRDFSYTAGVRIVGIHQWVTTMHHVDRVLEAQQKRLAEEVRGRTERERRDRQYKAFGDMINAAFWRMELRNHDELVGVVWSDELRRMYGYENEEDFPNALEAWAEGVHPDDRARAVGYFWDSVRARGAADDVYDVTYRFVRKGGDCRWYHSFGRVEPNADGTRTAYGLTTDVTVEKELEERERQLGLSRRKVSALLALSSQYISAFEVDLKTGLYEIVKRPDTTEVMDREDRRWDLALGRDFAAECLPESRELMARLGDIAFLRDELAQSDHRDYGYRHRLAVGNTRRRRCSVVVIDRDADGTAASALVSFMGLDEAAAERLNRAEWDGRYRPLLLNLLHLLLGELDVDNLTQALGFIVSGLGCSRAYLLRNDRHDGMIRLVAEARKDDTVRPLEADFAYPTSRERGWNDVSADNCIRAADVFDPETIERYGLLEDVNRALGIRSLYVVRLAVGGGNWGSVGITYESGPHELSGQEWEYFQVAANMLQLTAVHAERQSELARERDRARAAEQAKSFFFSTVSHDIRTPLNAIVGYAELLKLGLSDETERKRAVDSVLVSSQTLLQLINDVLDLSKLEAGRMEILPEPVDIRKLVEDVASSFRVSVAQKPVEIRTNIAPIPWLKLDPHRIRQILFNLVGNAVKFTEKGYVEIDVSYEPGEGRRGTFSFSVNDSGCGISDEDKLRIAQPYVQAGSSTSRNKGTGLGLAICRQLVSKMGGRFELQSLLGCGSTFYVTIPDVEEEGEARRARLSATQRIRFTFSDRPKAYGRVLIVDDQAMNRMVLKTMLSKFGITDIDTAENGIDALEKLRKVKEGGEGDERLYDLVLTDMWMPELDGEGLIHEIRRNPAWEKLPVYAVTADVEAQQGALDAGFTGILLKPITSEKLKEILN